MNNINFSIENIDANVIRNKYAKGIFNYSTPYKKQHLDEFNTLDKFNTREPKK